MAQLGLFPRWQNFENLHTYNYSQILDYPPPEKIFDAYWIEEKTPEEAKYLSSRMWGRFSGIEWSEPDLFISYRQVDRFICVRRLASAPLGKRSDLTQIELNRTLLWNPEATSRDLKAAKALAARMRAAGQGNFDWHIDRNSALWVKRVAVGSC